jgi:hypothetical protein
MSEPRPLSDEQLAAVRRDVDGDNPATRWELRRLLATIDARDARIAELERVLLRVHSEMAGE